MALVSTAYTRILQSLWQEMLMENICIVKWVLNRIVWPIQGFARRAVMFLTSLQELGGTLAPVIQTIPSRLAVQYCSVYFEGWWSLGIYGLPCPCLCPLSAVASQLGHFTSRFLSLWLHMHWGLYTCYVQELMAEAATKAVWKALHLVLLKDDKGLLLLQ